MGASQLADWTTVPGLDSREQAAKAVFSGKSSPMKNVKSCNLGTCYAATASKLCACSPASGFCVRSGLTHTAEGLCTWLPRYLSAFSSDCKVVDAVEAME